MIVIAVDSRVELVGEASSVGTAFTDFLVLLLLLANRTMLGRAAVAAVALFKNVDPTLKAGLGGPPAEYLS